MQYLSIVLLPRYLFLLMTQDSHAMDRFLGLENKLYVLHYLIQEPHPFYLKSHTIPHRLDNTRYYHLPHGKPHTAQAVLYANDFYLPSF